MKNFEPNIIGFVCNWCTYAGADLAGSSRYSYPPNVKLILLMCSGRVDPAFILETFARGADGVFVGGCHIPSDCHYQQGNFKALKRVTMLKKLISEYFGENLKFLDKFGIKNNNLNLIDSII